MAAKDLLGFGSKQVLLDSKACAVQEVVEVDSIQVEIGRLLSTVSTPDRESLPLARPHIDRYRIGLIPVENLTRRASSPTCVLTKPDSVLVLPLTWNELVSSVHEQLSPTRSEGNTVRFGLAFADFSRMEASRSGKPVALTPIQFKVLEYFARNPQRVISRNELLNEVWGYNHYPTTRTVDNAVLRLRRALEPVPSKPVHFTTVYGAGYKFVP